MQPFVFQTAGKILFGRGTADEAVPLVLPQGARLLLVRGNSVEWVDEFRARLEKAGMEVVEHRTQGEPTLADIRAVTDLGRNSHVAQVVAVGGGSVIDLGKAAAALVPQDGDILEYLEIIGSGARLEAMPLHFTAIPTTAGTGAEVTKNAVVACPEAQFKASLRDERMFPQLALVDPGLTDGTPLSVTLSSGMDALTQVIEPFLSTRANPMLDALCKSAIEKASAALATLAQGENACARDELSYASLMGGIALSNAGLGAVHGFAAAIGGRTKAPHGLICARLLGPVLKVNSELCRQAKMETAKYDYIRKSMSSATGLTHTQVFDELGEWLTQRTLSPLSNWVSQADDIDAICDAARQASSMKSNPHVLTTEQLRTALTAAL
ncbi:iron-containing alcohol dehydrogenase [Roseovarius sp. CAU 1744]|uniref:iron-containing alcohol dehydrogenase n=1 Tax=Roseovarius sp. CAU 1744 TaxID=3140368 RepID=UPI00325BACFD